jgi:cytosine permease
MKEDQRAGKPGGGAVSKDFQDDALHDHALDAVPAVKRKTLWQLCAVQIGWNISISAFLVGGVVGAGTTFTTAITALALGNLFLVVVASLVGYVGYRTGLTSYLVSRVVFGLKGSVLVSLVLGVLAMGFIGVLMDSFGTAFTTLVPAIPWTAVVLFLAGGDHHHGDLRFQRSSDIQHCCRSHRDDRCRARTGPHREP